MDPIAIIAISFSCSFAVTPLVIKLAKRFNAVDNPGIRRFHKKVTPRWGGIAFFIGMVPAVIYGLWTSHFQKSFLLLYIIASFLLIVLGAIDDVKMLGWKFKMSGMFVATSLVIFGSDIVIRQIGRYGQAGELNLGYFSIPFTYFSIIGVTNAINLIDGLNGLAGGVSLLAFLFMGIAASLKGNQQVALLCYAFVGSLLGFLRYNFSKARIFMGDSGSLFLGFSVSIVSILLTQDVSHPVEPTFPVLVLLLPIFDTLRVMFIRVFNMKNPFLADKTHLHHLIVRKKFPASRAVTVLWLLTGLFGAIALYMIDHSSIPYAIIILCFSLVLSFFADALTRRR